MVAEPGLVELLGGYAGLTKDEQYMALFRFASPLYLLLKMSRDGWSVSFRVLVSTSSGHENRH